MAVRAGHYFFALWFLSFFFFRRLISAVADWMSTIRLHMVWRCGPSVNLECKYEMYCTRLVGNAGPKKSPKNSPSGHHRTTLSGYIFATEAHIDNPKKLLNSSISTTCPYNMVNFGLY